MLYPCVYIVLTLPLSIGRMWSMAHPGHHLYDPYAIAAAALLTSCGWIDSLLYTLTRKALLRDTMAGGSTRAPSVPDDIWAATELGTHGLTHTRRVTLEGGQLSDVEPQDKNRAVHHSPCGSIDPILTGTDRMGAKPGASMQAMLEDFNTTLETNQDLKKVPGVTDLPSYHQRRAKF